VRRVDASRIDEDKGVGVVLFKTSLSTGWDWPRAEVMMSFRWGGGPYLHRPALGAHGAHLFLPYFDEAAVKAVVEDLRNVEQVPPAETGSARELVTLGRREDAADIFEAMDKLVTHRMNAARAQSHLRRYMGFLAQTPKNLH
jgi:type III restriction enzyme